MLKIDSQLSIDTDSKKFKEDREIESLSDHHILPRRSESKERVRLRQREVLSVIVLGDDKALRQKAAQYLLCGQALLFAVKMDD